MKIFFTLLFFMGYFSTYSQTDTLSVSKADTLQPKIEVITQIDSLKQSQNIENHAPTLLNKNPEILWFNHFRQVLSYQFPVKGFYRDEENNEIAFRLISKEYAGIRLSSEGLLTAQLSLAEYQKLPFTIDYEIFEINTPQNLATKGQISLKRSKNDYPPNINIYPKTLKYSIEETDSVAIRVMVADINEDLKEFEVYSSVQFGRFNPNNLLQKTEKPNEYWFRWKPSYDFVQIRNETDEKKRNFQLIFEAKDETDSTTKVAIDFEVFDKIDWSFEDRVRQQDYQKIVFSSTEALLRLEDKFNGMKKEITKLLKNKKLANTLKGSLNLLSKNTFLQNKLLNDSNKDWLDVAKDTQAEVQANGVDMQREYPEEFAKIERFKALVKYLKDVFVDTEAFVGRYRSGESRRTTLFITEKENLQKSISAVLRDTSLELMPLPTPISAISVKEFFGDF